MDHNDDIISGGIDNQSKRKSERMDRRLDFLTNVFLSYFGDWDNCYLNKSILREVVECYYRDIDKSSVQFVDRVVSTAHVMKWISHLRPIQIFDTVKKPSRALMMANAYFAFLFGMMSLEIDFADKSSSDTSWWSWYTVNTVNLLHYHYVSVESLSSELRVLEQFSSKC